MKKLLSILLTLAMLVTLVSMAVVPVSAQASVKTQAEAVSWLNSCNGKTFGDGQCVSFVKAYVNWLLSGNANGSVRVGFPKEIGSNLKNYGWQVINYTSGFVPQPGDIFVSKGYSDYGHAGVVIESTATKATIAEANVDAPPYNGGPVRVSSKNWTSYLTPTQFIRPVFSGSSTPTAHKHNWVFQWFLKSHPHYDVYKCSICGEEYTDTNSAKYYELCDTCKKQGHTHNWVFQWFLKSHPHYDVYKCSICGEEYTDTNSAKYYELCDTCNAIPGKPTLSVKATDSNSDVVLKSSVPTNTTSFDYKIFDASGRVVSELYGQPSTVSVRLNAGTYSVFVAACNDAIPHGSSNCWWTNSDSVSFTVKKATTQSTTKPTTKPTGSPSTNPTTPAASLLGDANDDNAVNMKDVLLVRKYIASMTEALNLVNADVNEDSTVNMKDVLALRKILANIN